MPLVRLRHVNKFVDRHGRVRIYFRQAGCKAIPLPGPIGSPEFMEAYNAAISEPLPKVGVPLKAGTLAALAISYFNSGRSMTSVQKRSVQSAALLTGWLSNMAAGRSRT